jgi:hypothetical protein
MNRMHGFAGARLDRPGVPFTGTKTYIESLDNVPEGAVAYATDTDEIGSYNGSVWIWGQGGGSTGWIPAIGNWAYQSADDPTFTISITGTGGIFLSSFFLIGDKIRYDQSGTTKFGIITGMTVSFPTPNVTLKVYGGTDYDLANAAISSPFFSHARSPLDFPMDPAKWSVKVTDSSRRTQTSPTASTWYNLGSISIDIPIGVWFVAWSAMLMTRRNGTAATINGTLSTANNSESNSEFTAGVIGQGATSAIFTAAGHAYQRRPLTLSSKTTHYLNAMTNQTGADNIEFRNDQHPAIIEAVCAYL